MLRGARRIAVGVGLSIACGPTVADERSPVSAAVDAPTGSTPEPPGDSQTSGDSSGGGSSEGSGSHEPHTPCPDALTFTTTMLALPGGGTPTDIDALFVHAWESVALVVTDATGRVLVFPSVGDGTFETPTIHDAGAGVEIGAVASENITEDGAKDLVVADTSASSTAVLVFEGWDDGTFTGPLSVPVGGRPVDVAASDYDRDGWRDLAVQLADDGVAVFYGDGEGGFELGSEWGVSAAAAFASGDLDRDDTSDLLGVDFETYTLVVRRNLGDRSFDNAAALTYPLQPNAVAMAHLGRDREGDIVVTSGGGPRQGLVHIWVASDQMVYDDAPIVLPAPFPVDIAYSDHINDDFWADIVVGSEASAATHGIWIILDDGDALGGCTFEIPLDGAPVGVAVEEFNGDDLVDLAVPLASGSVAVLLQE